MKHIFDFYINSSIHVALSVVSLSWLTLIEFGIDYDEYVLAFIFFATITGYNFVKFFGLAKFHYRKLANWLKVIQAFSFVCFLLLCYYTLKIQTTTLIYLSVLGAVTFLYAIPFLPKKIFLDSQQNLRGISGLKIYIIAFVWAAVTVLIPLLNNNYEVHADVFLTILQRFVLVLVLMLPFEIRDMQYDSIKLSTIPQRIGIKKTKTIGLVLTMLFFFLEFFKDEIVPTQLTILLVITFLLMLSLVFAKKSQSKYYSGFWVESIPIIWLCLMLLFR